MKTFILALLAVAMMGTPAWADHHGEGMEASMDGGMHKDMPDMKMDAVAEVGKPAPEFMANDINGNHVMLSLLKGQTVVLEWTNHECPYVNKYYSSGTMQALQKEATGDGVIWVSIVSSAKGKEGYTTSEEARTIMEEQGAHPTYKVLDTDGTIGHLYGAKTTPHMFIINKDGILVYSGAIDDSNSFKPETLAGAKNYVREALTSLKEGKPIEVSSTQPFGCGVKY